MSSQGLFVLDGYYKEREKQKKIKIICEDPIHRDETTIDGFDIKAKAKRKCDMCHAQLCVDCSRMGFECIGLCERYGCRMCESKTQQMMCIYCVDKLNKK